jgi:uncharacterized membrane-anchored protein
MKRTSSVRGVAAAMLLMTVAISGADAKSFKEVFPNANVASAEAKTFLEGLNYQQGDIKLGAGGVVLKVPPKFYFLDVADAKKILVEAWGNPPETAEGILGMVMPADKMPTEDAWGAVLRFDADGFVSDDDAARIDYSALLKGMQDQVLEDNQKHAKAGFLSRPPVILVGWASPPYYDKASKKLHWAKEISFDGMPKNTVNYDIRALGRHGVLQLNFVAGIDDLGLIKSVMPAVLDMPEFEVGFRYQDYVPGTDKVAAYGLGGLIAGKALAKAGILAALLVFLKKGWILILVALVGLAKLVGRMFSKKSTQ